MKNDRTLGEILRSQGVTRRGFMKFCATTASMMALPPAMIPVIANALETARRPFHRPSKLESTQDDRADRIRPYRLPSPLFGPPGGRH